jgi:hypothetical protein
MILRVAFAILVTVAVVQASTVSIVSTAATAQPRRTLKQIKLTETQVQAAVASLKEMKPIRERLWAATWRKGREPTSDEHAKHDAQFELVARSHGFKDLDEHEEVVENMLLVHSSIDPQTKAFTDRRVAIEKDMADATADKTMPEQERKLVLEEFREELKSVQAIQFPTNIELVKKYYDQLADALNF